MIDLKDVNVSFSANAASFFFAFLAPGFLILFLLKPQLFIMLEFWKLFVLASAITAPPFLVAMLFSASAYFNLLRSHPGHIDKWGGPREWYLRLAINHAVSMFLIALLLWAFEFSVKGYVIAGCVLTASNFISEMYYFLRFTRDPDNFDYGWFNSIRSLVER
ncbi:hypothetical protein [Pseudomonas sp. NBRC 111119]|uniref:hypothetical protein n=1 Tax=Pseudomonas sp. NBRC 111119 TaxID=1661034 RepID=UPI00076195A1|nr:hypothetical protein [Pseudomonas sp. NBRC 111119]